ncbi:MAG: hypothetical protein KJ000_07510 [Pirellulaceae bacterium]|nr:hypothetical protein [Pirellulaceae bacterium]
MDLSKLPTWEELRRLPLRASVAYAVRYARRVQPLWQPCRADFDSQVETVERGLEAIEDFCRAEKLPRADFAAADRAAREMTADAADGVRFAAKTAAFALRSVGHAIEAGNQAASVPDAGSAVVANIDEAFEATEIDRETAEALAAVLAARRASRVDEAPWDADEVAHLAQQAAEAAWAAAGSEDAFHVANDFQRLRCLALGKFPELGQPIDPGEYGPLGKLWSGPAPRWFIRQRTFW